jgi:anti-sigma factor RsiW
MTDPVNDQDLMRYLDGELAPDERARVEEALASSTELREQLDAFRSLRSGFHELTFPDASCDRSIWHRVAAHVAGRSGRGFFLAGVAVWLAYAVFVVVTGPRDAWERLGVAAVAIGILALFAAVIRDRYRSWSDDP